MYFRRQQEIESSGHGSENPALMNELRALRMRKDELETHLTTLQDSRRQLMIQLEGLMKMLKNHQSSPRSTPNSSPRSTKSPPLPPGAAPTQSGPRSAPQTPLGQPPTSQSISNPMSTLERNSHMSNHGQLPASMINMAGNTTSNTHSLERDDRRLRGHSQDDFSGDVRSTYGGPNNINLGRYVYSIFCQVFQI